MKQAIFIRGGVGEFLLRAQSSALILYELHVKLIIGEGFPEYTQVKHCSWNSIS